jgi:hypothetical protein
MLRTWFRTRLRHQSKTGRERYCVAPSAYATSRTDGAAPRAQRQDQGPAFTLQATSERSQTNPPVHEPTSPNQFGKTQRRSKHHHSNRSAPGTPRRETRHKRKTLAALARAAREAELRQQQAARGNRRNKHVWQTADKHHNQTDHQRSGPTPGRPKHHRLVTARTITRTTPGRLNRGSRPIDSANNIARSQPGRSPGQRLVKTQTTRTTPGQLNCGVLQIDSATKKPDTWSGKQHHLVTARTNNQ